MARETNHVKHAHTYIAKAINHLEMMMKDKKAPKKALKKEPKKEMKKDKKEMKGKKK